MRSCRKGPAPSLETIAYTERESPPELHIWSSLQHNRAPNSSNNLQQAALIPRAFPSNPGPLSKTLRNWKWYHRNRQLVCEIHTGLEEKQERGKTGISGVSETTKKKEKKWQNLITAALIIWWNRRIWIPTSELWVQIFIQYFKYFCNLQVRCFL